jgi:hypothetical protein
MTVRYVAGSKRKKNPSKSARTRVHIEKLAGLSKKLRAVAIDKASRPRKNSGRRSKYMIHGSDPREFKGANTKIAALRAAKTMAKRQGSTVGIYTDGELVASVGPNSRKKNSGRRRNPDGYYTVLVRGKRYDNYHYSASEAREQAAWLRRIHPGLKVTVRYVTSTGKMIGNPARRNSGRRRNSGDVETVTPDMIAGETIPCSAVTVHDDGSIDIIQDDNAEIGIMRGDDEFIPLPNPRRASGRIKNVAMGFYANGVFHPIRASSDYQTSRTASESGPKYKSKTGYKKPVTGRIAKAYTTSGRKTFGKKTLPGKPKPKARKRK